MPPKKPMMNDMVPMKKTAPQKQVLTRPEKERPRPIVEKPEEIFKNPVGYSKPPEEKRRGGCVLWFIAIICVVALIIGIGGLFTEATIYITPKTFEGTIDMPLTLSQLKTTEGVSFATAVKTFTEEKIIPATTVADRESFAAGIVRIYNPGTTAKKLEKGTSITSTAKREYRLSKAVTVPAAKGKTPGQIDVSVAAVIAGSDANSDLTDFVFTKSTKVTTGMTIRSVTPLTGGAKGAEAIADPTQVTAASEEVKSRFTKNDVLIKRMAEDIPDSSLVLPVVLPTSAPTVTVESNHSDGVHVIAKESITIILVNRNEIARALGNSLQAPEGILLTLPSFEGLTATTSSFASNQPIPATIQVRITGKTLIRGVIEESQVVRETKGLYRKAARKILLEKPEIESIQIKMRPFWRRSLPMSPDDISVAFDL